MKALVADDDRLTRKVVCSIIKKIGYDSICFENGKDVITYLKDPHDVDVLIIDWQMPHVSGVEICEFIRKKDHHLSKHVILLTALAEESHLIEGFKKGVNDYVTKPFRLSELEARIRIGFKMAELRNEITFQNKKLLEAEKAKWVSQMTYGMSHEIRNPLAIITGSNEIIQSQLRKKKIDFEKLLKHSSKIATGCNRVFKILDLLKKLETKEEKKEGVPFDLDQVFELVLEAFQERFSEAQVELQMEKSKESCVIAAEESEVIEMIFQLLSNAYDAAIESTESKWIKIEINTTHENIDIIFKNNGKLMSAEQKEKVMIPFFSGKPLNSGQGLGLSVVKSLAQKNGGHLELVTIEPHTEFHLSLKKAA